MFSRFPEELANAPGLHCLQKAARMDVTQQVSIAGAAADYMQKLDAVEAAQKVLLDEQLLVSRKCGCSHISAQCQCIYRLHA